MEKLKISLWLNIKLKVITLMLLSVRFHIFYSKKELAEGHHFKHLLAEICTDF